MPSDFNEYEERRETREIPVQRMKVSPSIRPLSGIRRDPPEHCSNSDHPYGVHTHGLARFVRRPPGLERRAR
jgi:hypothetical protein